MGFVALAFFAPAAAQGMMQGRSVGEGAVERLPELDLIPRQDALHLTREDRQNIWVAGLGFGITDDGGLAAEKREGVAGGPSTDIEHEAGLIQNLVVRGAVVDAADEVERGVERELGQLAYPSLRLFGFSAGHFRVVSRFDARGSGRPDPFGPNPEVERYALVDILVLVGEDYLPRYYERISLRLLTHAYHCLIRGVIETAYQQPGAYRDILGWRVAHVFGRNVNPEIDADLVIRRKACWLGFSQHHPGPAACDERILSDVGLSPGLYGGFPACTGASLSSNDGLIGVVGATTSTTCHDEGQVQRKSPVAALLAAMLLLIGMPAAQRGLAKGPDLLLVFGWLCAVCGGIWLGIWLFPVG